MWDVRLHALNSEISNCGRNMKKSRILFFGSSLNYTMMKNMDFMGFPTHNLNDKNKLIPILR